MYARAEQERSKALEAHAIRDDVGASLHAEHAMAAYEHALVMARAARAAANLADAQRALDQVSGVQQSLDASRSQLERDASDLAHRVEIARTQLQPAASAPASPDREAARLVAARSLAVEAHLLCAAARLIAPEAQGLSAAESNVSDAQAHLDHPGKVVAIDDAARSRVQCLDVLTRARRSSGAPLGAADGLLAELSASGGLDLARDERGVVVTLRGIYHGSTLTDAGASTLKDLGRVAAAHPAFALQVVVHDAAPRPGGDPTDSDRGKAAAGALVDAGATAGRVGVELAGAREPVADPASAAQRPRNERVDVVFVGQ
jgi:flagellar motor protein MotB